MKIKLLSVALLAFGINASAQWESQNTNLPDYLYISDIQVVSPSVVWAVAADATGNQAPIQEFTRTIDGGQTWMPDTVNGAADHSFSNIHALNADTAWVAMYNVNGGGGIFRTNDGGQTWAKQTTATFSAPAGFPNIVYFWDADSGFAMGDPNGGYFEIYTTVNGGTNWTRVATANIPNELAGEYGIVDMFSVIGDTVWFGTNKGRVYRSTNRGYNWTVATTGLTSISEVQFRDAMNGIVQETGTILKRTTDGGSTWMNVTPEGMIYEFDMVYVPGTTTLVSGGAGTVTGSSYSPDDGEHWYDLDSQPHTSLDFIDANTGWSGGISNGGIGGAHKFLGFPAVVTPVAGFTASADTICPNQTVAFTDTSSNTPVYWEWMFPGGTPSTSTLQNPTIKYSTSGAYDVTLIAFNAGGSDTITKVAYITVNAAPTVSATASATTVETGDTINFMANATGADTYFWNFGGDTTSTEINPSHAFANQGTYIVSVTATNAQGCSTTDTIKIKVNLPVGIGKSLKSSIISVNPNPTTGILKVNFKNASATSSVNVFNMLGQSVYSVITNGLSSKTIDLTSFNNGIYMVEIKNGDTIKTVKVVKQ